VVGQVAATHDPPATQTLFSQIPPLGHVPQSCELLQPSPITPQYWPVGWTQATRVVQDDESMIVGPSRPWTRSTPASFGPLPLPLPLPAPAPLPPFPPPPGACVGRTPAQLDNDPAATRAKNAKNATIRDLWLRSSSIAFSVGRRALKKVSGLATYGGG
jgi:hypothetical protein